MRFALVTWLLIILTCGLAGLSLSRAAAAAAPAPARRPNFIFILIDDMGYRDLSCFGGMRVKTPQIDRLAREGMKFDQFYVASPICSPSRTGLLTGQFPARWRITSYLDNRAANQRRGMAQWLSTDAPSVARFLHQAGYYTAHVGKWHMGGQRDVGDAPAISAYGFDTSLTNFEGLGPRLLPRWENNADGTPFRHGPTDMSAKLGGPITWVERHRVTEKFVDRALEEIGNAQRQGKPFYMNLWPDDVHSPCQAPPGMRGDGSPAANYCGVLVELDRQVGRIFEHVRSNPELRDNTIILLCSDNGHEQGLGSSGELRGSKGQLYEGGIRSPLIVWAPGKMKKEAIGTTNSATLMGGVDLAPSILSLAGVAAPKDVAFDGVDMSAAMVGEAAPQRSKALMWVRPPDRPGPRNGLPDLAIREGKWKLMVMRDGSRAQLYDILADPTESKNLAREQAEVTERLKKQVMEWDKQMSK